MLIGGFKNYLPYNGSMFEFYTDMVLNWLWGIYDNQNTLIVGIYWSLGKFYWDGDSSQDRTGMIEERPRLTLER